MMWPPVPFVFNYIDFIALSFSSVHQDENVINGIVSIVYRAIY